MKTASVLVVFVVGLCTRCVCVEDGNAKKMVYSNQEMTCSQYCDGTYPEHTYPDPEDHCACTRGCRLAVMNALMAWPLEPDTASCLTTCEAAYIGERQLFACKLGCNVSTINQKIPNRDHIYPTETNTSEIGFVMGLFEMVIADLLPQFIVISDDITELSQHAQTLYQLLPCYEGTTYIVMEENGELTEVQYTSSCNPSPQSSYEMLGPVVDEEEDELDSTSETSTYRLSCPWGYTTTGRLLLLVGVGLIAVALFSCCCASFMPEERSSDDGVKKGEHHFPVRATGDQVYVHLKSPVVFSPGYPQPVPYYREKKM